MINLLYIVLLAMLALNVSSDVLKGFTLIGDSLRRTIDNATKENELSTPTLRNNTKPTPPRSSPGSTRPWPSKP